MSLPNADILGHPLGTPKSGDFFLFQSPTDLVTRKCAAQEVINSSTSNFEWLSNANDGEGYAEDEVVTYGGLWWQSQVDENLSVPGVNSDWLLLTRGYSWQIWAAGVFVETDTYVLVRKATATFIYELVDVARPYVSANFETELAAGDWREIGQCPFVVVDSVPDILAFNCLNLYEVNFNLSAALDEAKEFQFTNMVQNKKGSIKFAVSITGVITLPTNWRIANATNALLGTNGVTNKREWEPLAVGAYEVFYTNDGTIIRAEIIGPYE